ncbi:MAG: hypothetical protein V2B15_19210 [Bacteroidota bacterium]
MDPVILIIGIVALISLILFLPRKGSVSFDWNPLRQADDDRSRHSPGLLSDHLNITILRLLPPLPGSWASKLSPTLTVTMKSSAHWWQRIKN